MKESVSALMDGESSDQEAAQILGAVEKDDALKTTWDEYHLIGDALRNNALLNVNVHKHVAARLVDEPTVLAPRGATRRRAAPMRVATWALAASVSFAAVIAWQQLGKDQGMQATQVARVSNPPAQALAERDSSYLLAHQEMVSDPNLAKASIESSGVRH